MTYFLNEKMTKQVCIAIIGLRSIRLWCKQSISIILPSTKVATERRRHLPLHRRQRRAFYWNCCWSWRIIADPKYMAKPTAQKGYAQQKKANLEKAGKRSHEKINLLHASLDSSIKGGSKTPWEFLLKVRKQVEELPTYVKINTVISLLMFSILVVFAGTRYCII